MKQLIIIILLIFLFYYGAKLFIRVIFPRLLFKFFEKQMDNMNRQQEFDETNQTGEGEIRMSGKPKSKTKTDDKSFGEYIEFEEINDNEKSESDD